MERKKGILFFSVIAILAMLWGIPFVSCSDKKTEKATLEPDETEEIEFDVLTVVSREVTKDIEGLGSLSFFDKATVLAKVDGVVDAVYVKKGDRVRPGDAIMKLSNYQLEVEKMKADQDVIAAREELDGAKMEYEDGTKSILRKFLELEKSEMQIKNAELELKFMKENFERKKILYQSGGITEEEFRSLEFSLGQKTRELELQKKDFELQMFGFRDQDIIDAGYKVPSSDEERKKILIEINTKMAKKKVTYAEIRVKTAQMESDRIAWLLAKTTVISPIAGVVTDIAKYIGEKVKTDDEITTVLNLDKLVAKASFSETDLDKIRVNQTVTVYVESINKSFKGTVYTKDAFIDVATRTFSVDCVIGNAQNLIPGMFVKVTVPVQAKKKLLLIPKGAYMKGKDGGGYVYLVSPQNIIFQKNVKCESFDDEFLTVQDGLSEGDKIIRNPIMNLHDGMKIKTVQK